MALCAVLLLACSGNKGNKEEERILSDKPIKTEVLGLKLCDVCERATINSTISKTQSLWFTSEQQDFGAYSTVRCSPNAAQFPYGGMAWHYVDVDLNQKSQIVRITLMASYESLDQAKDHFEGAKGILSNKYGKGNDRQEGTCMLWTDNTNTVGTFYYEGSTIYGQDRSFCGMYYINIALADAVEAASQPDV